MARENAILQKLVAQLIAQCIYTAKRYLFQNSALQQHFTPVSVQVRTEEELKEAIEASLGPNKDSLCFIEVTVHKDDTSKELLVWGARLFAANNRPPNPQ